MTSDLFAGVLIHSGVVELRSGGTKVQFDAALCYIYVYL